MSEKLLLGIDLGTTALKAVVFNYKGQQIVEVGVEYDLINLPGDVVEEDPEIYWQSIKTALGKAAQKCDLKNITGISFSTQGETLLFMDENGKPLRNAIVWMDNRAKDEALYLKEKFTDEVCYKICGQVGFDPCWPATKILWVREHEPEIFAKTKKFLLLEDYIIYRMTGKYVAECSLLTSTTYWDITTKKYWSEMLAVLGISEAQLPEVRESGEPVATLLPEIAKELGMSTDAMVCTGGLDQAAGAIGVGNVRSGLFSENIGAAMAICAICDKLTYDPQAAMPVHYFALPDTYMMHTFTSGGMNLRWFRDAFCQLEMAVSELTGKSDYALLDAEALQAPAGCNGMVMMPHLSGAMAPDLNANAKGVFYGFSLSHTKAHFIRAIMEALGFILMRNLDALAEMGIHVDEIRSLGGGARSDAWNQIKADITGRKISTMKCKEAASLGAAIFAGKGIGVFDSVADACEGMVEVDKTFLPNPEHRAAYDQAYAKYKKLFKDLTEVFEMR